MAQLFLSPIVSLSVTFLIFNRFGAYYSETATLKSSTQQSSDDASKNELGIVESIRVG